MGAVLAAERPLEPIEWAASCGGFTIEDDHDAEYRYTRSVTRTCRSLVRSAMA